MFWHEPDKKYLTDHEYNVSFTLRFTVRGQFSHESVSIMSMEKRYTVLLNPKDGSGTVVLSKRRKTRSLARHLHKQNMRSVSP